MCHLLGFHTRYILHQFVYPDVCNIWMVAESSTGEKLHNWNFGFILGAYVDYPVSPVPPLFMRLSKKAMSTPWNAQSCLPAVNPGLWKKGSEKILLIWGTLFDADPFIPVAVKGFGDMEDISSRSKRASTGGFMASAGLNESVRCWGYLFLGASLRIPPPEILTMPK